MGKKSSGQAVSWNVSTGLFPANTERSPNIPEWSLEDIFFEPNKNVIGTFHEGYF